MKQKNKYTCKYGKGKQDMSKCKMIYLHINGYYDKESYKEALKNLCPNYIKKEKSKK